jgi:hypothetical protein
MVVTGTVEDIAAGFELEQAVALGHLRSDLLHGRSTVLRIIFCSSGAGDINKRAARPICASGSSINTVQQTDIYQFYVLIRGDLPITQAECQASYPNSQDSIWCIDIFFRIARQS